MSIIVSNMAYHHANRLPLFENLDFSVPAGRKVAIVGNNGSGKSTLLRIIAGELEPQAGVVQCSTRPYYIPQQIVAADLSVAEALGVADKLAALAAITGGSSEPAHFDALADEWDIESRCREALDHWGLYDIMLATPFDMLSGGERTKVYLAGLHIHSPETVLLDEPTNHLDTSTRTKLYDWVAKSKATMVIVSHDITLLRQIDTTYGLSEKGLQLYGGNYDFYREQKELEESALAQRIDAEETALRQARRKARQVHERQQRRESHAAKTTSGVPRIILNARHDKGENTSAKLSEKHADIIGDTHRRLTELRVRQHKATALKIDFDDASLHNGKLLIEAAGVNFSYDANDKDISLADRQLLWPEPLELEIRSGERIHLTGDNGSGKTTLVRLLTGELAPSSGTVWRAPDFSYIYLDQQYSQVCRDVSVLEMAGEHNLEKLQDHEVKVRLDRALFPRETWNKNCLALSGGERMRLYLCCLMLSNHVPDTMILDEPTNNLDLQSLAILTDTVKNYRGTIVVISHDMHFAEQIGITTSIELTRKAKGPK